MKIFIVIAGAIANSVMFDVSPILAENYQKLTGAQVRAELAGMEITDEIHWRDVYERDGTVRSHSMGRRRLGKWLVRQDELCVDLGKEEAESCYEVWLSGRSVELRPSGLGLSLKGVLRKPTDRN